MPVWVPFVPVQPYGPGMSDFTIRAARPAEAPVILALLRELAIYEKAPVFQLSESTVQRDMFGAACHCDLAFQGGKPAGIVTWFWTYKSFRAARYLFVEDLYVKPEFRGQGFGIQLWRAGMDRLAGRNVALDGVVDQQENYRKSGFERVLNHIRYSGVPAVGEAPGGVDALVRAPGIGVVPWYQA